MRSATADAFEAHINSYSNIELRNIISYFMTFWISAWFGLISRTFFVSGIS